LSSEADYNDELRTELATDGDFAKEWLTAGDGTGGATWSTDGHERSAEELEEEPEPHIDMNTWEACLPIKCIRKSNHCTQVSANLATGAGADGVGAGTDGGVCCVEVLTSLLEILTSVLSAHGLQHLLFFGALLGEARNGTVIPWTSDMDILVPPIALAKLSTDVEIRRELREKGVHFFQDDMYQNEGLGRVCAVDEVRASGARPMKRNVAVGTAGTSSAGDFEKLRLKEVGDDYAIRREYYRYFPYVDLYAAAPASGDYGRTLQVRPSTDLMTKDCTWGMSGEGGRLEECYTSVPIEAAFPSRKCRVRGREFSCPNDSVTVLTLLYGTDYLVPRKATVGTDYEELDLSDTEDTTAAAGGGGEGGTSTEGEGVLGQLAALF
jgi:hypothetical protein